MMNMTIDINELPHNITDQLNIVITDTDNIITFVSDSFAKLMNYTVDELVGHQPSILKYSATTYLSSQIWKKLDTKHHWNGILKDKKKNGEILYFTSDIYKNFDSDGKHIGYHAIHADITKSINNPSSFIFENELFELMFSNEDEISVVCLCKSPTNPIHQKILEISKKFTDLIGISRQHILDNNLSFTDIISKQSKYYNNVDLLIKDSIDNKEIFIQLDTVNNETRTCALSVLLFDIQSEDARVFKLTDITNELKYTHQLKNINTTKNNFLANFSHEIKTPLNAIVGFLSLLQMKETEKEKQGYIDIILDSATHLLDMMNDVLDFTSIDNKKLEIVPREFTPKDIQSIIEIFYARSLEKNLEFSVYISPQIPEIMRQDILRIKQIISNLISNAIKFAGESGAIIIDCFYHNNNLHFSITDNGIGMTPEQIHKVFNPFEQADMNTKLFYGGTGLGLSVVKDIIELMGGTITIESEPDAGSTFSVIIPTKSVKTKRFEGKLEIDNISIFAPSYSINKIETIKKYLIHFTTANIKVIDSLTNIKDDCLIINLKDVDDTKTINKLSKSNKIMVIKKLNDVGQDFNNVNNTIEINAPIVGSKLYDALSSILNNITNIDVTDKTLNLHVEGNILIADDLESNRILMKELLSNYNVNFDLVKNGKEALDKFKENIKNNKSIYDLVILDMNMPVMSGSRAAMKIRDFEKQLNIQRTPLVALTANRYNRVDDNNLINMDEYLPKPVNLKMLLSLIIKYTSNIDISNTDNNIKITKLKELRDNFFKNKFDGLADKDAQKYFTDEECKLLLQIKNLKDKRKFNILYNQIMKLVRKNN
jgi:PAS domain S-box-containing protein